MAAITVTARVQDSQGNVATKSTTANIGRNEDFTKYLPNNPAEVGVLPGVPRTEVQSLTVEPGGEYENLTVENLVNLPTVAAGAPAIKLRNVAIIGPDTAMSGSHTSLVKAWAASHAPIELWDSTLRPQKPSLYTNGIQGHSFKLYRVEIADVIDCVSVYNNNTGFRDGPNGVEVFGTYMHDFAYYYPDPSHSDGSHSDGVQIQSGSGFKMWGSLIVGHIGPEYGDNGLTYYDTTHTNASMMIKPDVGIISGCDIKYNRIFGGAISVNVSHDTSPTQRNITDFGSISYNRFGRDQRLQGGGGDNTWTIKFPINPVPVYQAIGNVYDDTGAPVRVRESA